MVWKIINIIAPLILGFCGMIGCTIFMLETGRWSMEYVIKWSNGIPIISLPLEIWLATGIPIALWFIGPHRYFLNKLEGDK